MSADLFLQLLGGLMVLAVVGWAGWRWRVPPQSLAPAVLETGEGSEPEPEEWPRSRRSISASVIQTTRRGIPWEQRIGNPKDTAIWCCQRVAEEASEVAPYLPALTAFRTSVEAWEAASGQSAALGWEVYRELGRLEKAMGVRVASHVSQAVLKAVSATPPQAKTSKEV
jgi:hypothetical protein